MAVRKEGNKGKTANMLGSQISDYRVQLELNPTGNL